MIRYPVAPHYDFGHSIPSLEMAEREGFEPPVPFWSTQHFQCCTFGHSVTSPLACILLSNRLPGQIIFVLSQYENRGLHSHPGSAIKAFRFCVPVAQLDRASDYGSEGCWFNSSQVRHFFRKRRSHSARQSFDRELSRLQGMSIENRITEALSLKDRFAWRRSSLQFLNKPFTLFSGGSGSVPTVCISFFSVEA